MSKRQRLLTSFFESKTPDEGITKDNEHVCEPVTKSEVNPKHITPVSSLCDPTSFNSTLTNVSGNERDPCHGPTLAEKFIDLGPFQPIISFPVTKGRKFRSEWFNIYTWLEYSPASDKAYCFVCRSLFQGTENKADEAFTSKGFCNWKKAVCSFENHQTSQAHLNNKVKINSLKEGKINGSIAEKLNSQYSKHVEENRKYLFAICETLIFCGRQNIPLRGHVEMEGSRNKGNFLELIELRCKDNDILNRFFTNREKNFRYTTGKFQNEILSITGNQIKENISEKIRKCGIFAIIVDETQDIAKHEQVSIVIRHTDDNLNVHESFTGFYRAEKTDGETLSNLVKSVITSLGLDIKNLRGQCYDGAANMCGIYKGVSARILAENPLAMFIHCHAHILNLCITTACSGITPVRNAFHTLQSIYNFIKKSIKKHATFERIFKSTKSFSGGATSLKSLCDTRWYCRVEAVRSLLDNFDVTLGTLNEISENDAVSGGESNCLLKCIEDFNFVFVLLLLRRVLTQTDILSKTLQEPNPNYQTVKDVVKSTQDALQTFRTDDFFDRLWALGSEISKQYYFKPAEMPRLTKIPSKLGGGTKIPYSNLNQFYKATVLYPVVDSISEEISNRFSENDIDILIKLSKILLSDKLESETVKEIAKFYDLNTENLQAELVCFYNIMVFHRKNIEEKAKLFVEKSLNTVFPNILELFRLYFTIPMSSASCERSFSCLRRLKTYLRNTIGQERLSSLALLTIEREITIDIEQVINDFEVTHKRRLHFSD